MYLVWFYSISLPLGLLAWLAISATRPSLVTIKRFDPPR